jgi:hypothetical protein
MPEPTKPTPLSALIPIMRGASAAKAAYRAWKAGAYKLGKEEAKMVGEAGLKVVRGKMKAKAQEFVHYREDDKKRQLKKMETSLSEKE